MSPQQMVELALVAELLELAWAQLSSEVPGWPEGPRGFHVASLLCCGSVSTIADKMFFIVKKKSLITNKLYF